MDKQTLIWIAVAIVLIIVGGWYFFQGGFTAPVDTTVEDETTVENGAVLEGGAVAE